MFGGMNTSQRESVMNRTVALGEGLVEKLILDGSFNFFARFPATQPLLESGTAGVNVRVQVLIDDARALRQS